MSDTNYPMQPGDGGSEAGMSTAAKLAIAVGLGAVGIVAFALILATGPEGLMAAARINVTRMLFDPESARFQDLKARTDTKVVCGYVNAKNKFGGYVGFRRFYFKEGGQVAIDDDKGYLAMKGYERECP